MGSIREESCGGTVDALGGIDKSFVWNGSSMISGSIHCIGEVVIRKLQKRACQTATEPGRDSTPAGTCDSSCQKEPIPEINHGPGGRQAPPDDDEGLPSELYHLGFRALTNCDKSLL
jgi:hypothetical protein